MAEPGTDGARSPVDVLEKPRPVSWAVGVDEADAPVASEETRNPARTKEFGQKLAEAMGVTSEVSKKLRGAILLANDILKKAKSDPVIITDESVAGMVRLIELELPPTEQIISGDERDDFSTLQTLIAEIKKLPEQKDALIQQTNEEVQRAVNSATLAQETEGAKQQVDLDQLPQQEIDASDIVPGPDGKLLQEQPDGSAVAKTVDGKEIKFNPGAVLAFLMIALLVDGDHTTRVIADQVSEGVSDYVMINFLGIDPDKVKSFVGHGEVSEQYLFFLDKYQLKDFLEKMVWQGRRKVYTILENLPENTRQELVQGKDVTRGGKTHKLEPELIGKILGVLNKDDLVRLRLDKVAVQQKADT